MSRQGEPRTTKRARRESRKLMPPIGMRLCVGDRAVPLQEQEVMDSGGDLVKLKFVHLTSRKADLTWLREAQKFTFYRRPFAPRR